MPIKFSVKEKKILSLAGKSDDPWGHLDTNGKLVKTKIKNYIKDNKSHCCYCRRLLITSHNRNFDLEHILPQKEFKELAFSFKNLNIACTRCNGTHIKGDKHNYYTKAKKPYFSALYSIIHPNLDKLNAHLKCCAITISGKELHLYKIINNSNKGLETYTFFKLQELVKDEIKSIQGITIKYTYDDIMKKLDIA